jgi:hypothetical protein
MNRQKTPGHMNEQDFNTDAYRAGVAAGEAYNADPRQNIFDDLPNPYPYGSDDWQRWNLGWNYTVMNA